MDISAGQIVECIEQHDYQRHNHLAPDVPTIIKFPMKGERYTVIKSAENEGKRFVELLELGDEYLWDARAFRAVNQAR